MCAIHKRYRCSKAQAGAPLKRLATVGWSAAHAAVLALAESPRTQLQVEVAPVTTSRDAKKLLDGEHKHARRENVQVNPSLSSTVPSPTFSVADRMLSLCMAQHPRLGVASPARELPPEILQSIFAFRDELEGAQLSLISMPAPRRDPDGTCHISCLRRFVLEVGLTDAKGLLMSPRTNLALKATLLHDNGTPVSLGIGGGSGAEELLWGDSATMDGSSGGRATFRLLINTCVSKFEPSGQPRRFRLQIAPRDAALSASHAHLTTISQPFRVATRLHQRWQAPPTAMPLRPSRADVLAGAA